MGSEMCIRDSFNVINLFGIHTGLNMNRDKTESLLLGNLKENASSLELDVCEFKRKDMLKF